MYGVLNWLKQLYRSIDLQKKNLLKSGIKAKVMMILCKNLLNHIKNTMKINKEKKKGFETLQGQDVLVFLFYMGFGVLSFERMKV